MSQLLAFSQGTDVTRWKGSVELDPITVRLSQNVQIIAAYMPQPLVPQLLVQLRGQRQPWLGRGLAINLDGQHIEAAVTNRLV